MITVGDIVQYVGPHHDNLRDRQHAQVTEIHEDMPGWVRVRTFTEDGYESSNGSVPAGHLKVVDSPSTHHLAVLADAHAAETRARLSERAELRRVREQEAFDKTAEICGCSAERVATIVRTFDLVFRDPTS